MSPVPAAHKVIASGPRPAPGPPMIDVHIHAVPPNLPGRARSRPLLREPPEMVAAEIRREMQTAGVDARVRDGRVERRRRRPARHQRDARHRRARPGLHAIGVADPTRTDADHFRRVEARARERGGGRAEGLPRLPALRAGPRELPPLLRTGREVPRAGHVPHRRHLLAASEAEVRPPARRR